MAHQHDHKALYVKVWLGLCVLTAITVGAAYINFGVWNSIIAMVIATTKALLVCWFFMHLKEDTALNRFAFFSSLIFLAIFVALTMSDIGTRPAEALAKVTPVEAPAGNESKLHEQYKNSNPELIAYGKTQFLAQCQACHGAAGKGDGPAAAAMNPKPRDFTSGYWKQGSTPSQVFHTISNGIAGTGMSSFASLSVKDRWALAHYIRSLSPNAAAETSESWNKSGLSNGAGSTDTAAAKLPTEMAMDLLVKEAQ